MSLDERGTADSSEETPLRPAADLGIIIVSYNTQALLGRCLESVEAGLERSRLRAAVWVVDNASSDGSAAMVARWFPWVHLVAHSTNAGFAAANNLGLLALDESGQPGPRHVLFLNPDTEVRGDALGEMVGFLDDTPAAGAAGARLVHADGSFQHSAFRFPGLMQILLDFCPVHHRLQDSRLNGRYPRSLYAARKPFRVGHPLGAALMVRKRVLDQVGGFDARYFMYCEEVDLCRRIAEAGWAIYCVPMAEILHLIGQSTQQFRDRMFVALWRSRYLMYARFENRAFQWAARQLVLLGLRVERLRTHRAHRRGEIDAAGLRARLAAYREVEGL